MLSMLLVMRSEWCVYIQNNQFLQVKVGRVGFSQIDCITDLLLIASGVFVDLYLLS